MSEVVDDVLRNDDVDKIGATEKFSSPEKNGKNKKKTFATVEENSEETAPEVASGDTLAAITIPSATREDGVKISEEPEISSENTNQKKEVKIQNTRKENSKPRKQSHDGNLEKEKTFIILKENSKKSEDYNHVEGGDSKSEEASSGYSSSPPTPTSPSSISPPHTLKRSRSSSFRLIDRKTSIVSISSQLSVTPETEDQLANVIGWYPAFLLRALYDLTFSFVYLSVTKLPVAIPTLWFSAWLWIFWKFIQIPVSIAKSILTFLFVPPVERYRKKRTVLISGGSSVQAIHLARNFYSAGARVVVCEIEGHFGLARFSTAVHKYYVIPEPNDECMELYINALKDIIVNEKVTYYIPVSETSAAYYDALSKPHIEALGCQCFCPDVKEVLFFDDTVEFMRKVHSHGTKTPSHYLVQSKQDLDRLYDIGITKIGDHFIVNVGPPSVRRKQKIELPYSRRMLKLTETISEQYPWLVVQDYKGHHFITCTTIKDSRVVANVTCRLDKSGHGLVPVEHNEIEIWLKQFFANLSSSRRVTGHMSFMFAVSAESGSIVPLECDVGIRLPYICYTSVHPRVVWKPCKHFSRSTSGPIVTDTGRYWVHEIFLRTLQHPSVEAVIKLAGILFDRKEALFVFWDPLPYCAFYYLQLPLNSISSKLSNSSKKLFINS